MKWYVELISSCYVQFNTMIIYELISNCNLMELYKIFYDLISTPLHGLEDMAVWFTSTNTISTSNC